MVNWESVSNLIILEKWQEVKFIDVKVFEEYFRDSNKGLSTNFILIEESCDCDWTKATQSGKNGLHIIKFWEMTRQPGF